MLCFFFKLILAKPNSMISLEKKGYFNPKSFEKTQNMKFFSFHQGPVKQKRAASVLSGI